MTGHPRETREVARNALVGDLVEWQQHGWCEVIERSNGPDPVVLRSSDGRIVALPPGEVVPIRRLWVANEPSGEEEQLVPASHPGTLSPGPSPEATDTEAEFLALYGSDDPQARRLIEPATRGAMSELDALERDVEIAGVYLEAVRTRIRILRGAR